MVRAKTDNKIYAMKVLQKNEVKKQHQVEHTLTERWVLAETNHPFITSLRFAFQSLKKLYLVMDYMVGGELFFHLQKEGRFTEKKCRFYAAELVSAISYLHSEEGGHVVYRDLKPENILLGMVYMYYIFDFSIFA
jgi:serine/threonine protein kinase